MRVLSAADAQARASRGGGIDDPKTLTDDEWKKRLTPEQYYVCRQRGTEAVSSHPSGHIPMCLYPKCSHLKCLHTYVFTLPCLAYPVVLVDRWAGNQLPPFLSPLSLPHGGAQCHARPFRDVVLPSLFLSASSSPSLHCALQDCFGKP